jgi:transposase
MCLITEAGEVLHQRIYTQRERFGAVCAERPRARILLEASTESEWVAQCWEEWGHEVMVADPNYTPRYAQRSRRVKTDRREAEALAHACRLGAYHPAHRTSERQRQVRAVRTVREAWVRSRPRWISVVRALVRQYGYHLRSGATEAFVDRVAERELPAALQAEREPLVRAMQSVNEPWAALEQQTAAMAQDDVVVQRFNTAPGGGPLPALACVATLDEVERFDTAHHVEISLGLVSREWSSGEQQQRGKITQQGKGQRRAWLVGAAGRIWCRKGTMGSRLRQWTERIAARRGKRVAVVALAQRLAGMLYALWRDGSVDHEAREGQRRHRVAVPVSHQG